MMIRTCTRLLCGSLTLPNQIATRIRYYDSKTVLRSRIERWDLSWKAFDFFGPFQMGRGLLQAGVNIGDKVLILTEQNPDSFLTTFGVTLAGGVACPINPAGLTAEGLEKLVDTISPQYIVFQPVVRSPATSAEKGYVDVDVHKIVSQVFPEYAIVREKGSRTGYHRYPSIKQIMVTHPPKSPQLMQSYGMLPLRHVMKNTKIADSLIRESINMFADPLYYAWNRIDDTTPALQIVNGATTTYTHSQLVTKGLEFGKQMKLHEDDRVLLTGGHPFDVMGTTATMGCMMNAAVILYSNPTLFTDADAIKTLKGIPANNATILFGTPSDIDALLAVAPQLQAFKQKGWLKSLERIWVWTDKEQPSSQWISDIKAAFGQEVKVEIISGGKLPDKKALNH